jgi:hypothetical protein
MQDPRQCPYCATTQIRRMAERLHELQTGVVWYQCLMCHQIWPSPKAAI